MAAPATEPESSLFSQEIESLDRPGHREVGAQAVWTLSTAKTGFGVDNLRDDNLDTFWQSDGAQPHLINIQFPRKIALSELLLYADFKADESYTPAKISIRTGTNYHDLQELLAIELKEPSGWVSIPLRLLRLDAGDDAATSDLRTHFVQVAILSNHQNGRDTHVRQVKVFGPIPQSSPFSTIEFTQYSELR